MTVSPNSFNCSDVGGNMVTLTVTDDLGWVSTCTATVTVNDITDPVITTAASNESVECDGAGNITEFNNWLNNNGGASASDACGGSWSNNSTGLSGGCGGTGSETVTFTFTDPSGNSASTIATFTVEDNTDPSVTCPDNIHLPECIETATWTVIASDACGDVTIVSDPPSGSTFEKGTTTTVNVTVTDDCGNTSTCSFEVERDPDLVVNINAIGDSPFKTCAYDTDANIVLGYGGGATCVSFTAVASGGHGPYTYSWEAPNAVPLGKFTNANTDTPTFCADFQTVHCATYIFEVTVTDVHGCTETAQIPVNVVNVGVFGDGTPCAMPNNPKVVVCHIAPGESLVETAMCVSPASVPAHLGDPFTIGHTTDCLGDCDFNCITYQPGAGKTAKSLGSNGSSYSVAVFPNPFKSETLIEVISDIDSDVSLAIYDLSGRVVADLFSGTMMKDVAYHFHFKPENLPSGIYFVKMNGANGGTNVAKLIYVN